MAVSIADNYLKSLADSNLKAPCLQLLAAACIFLAAKLEQNKAPNSRNYTFDLKELHGVSLTYESLLQLETSILFQLEFGLRFVSPIDFLAYFQRLFDHEHWIEDYDTAERITGLAQNFSRYMLVNASFLIY